MYCSTFTGYKHTENLEPAKLVQHGSATPAKDCANFLPLSSAIPPPISSLSSSVEMKNQLTNIFIMERQ